MADKPPPPSLNYEDDALLRSIRRGVRTLVLLTLVNTALLGAGFFAPALNAIARDYWAAYQKRKADAAAAVAQAAAATQMAAANRQVAAFVERRRAQVLAAQDEAMAHVWPAGTLVFAEDFAVGTLPAVGATSATLPATRNATTRRSAAGAASRPAFLTALPFTSREVPPQSTDVLLFSHARRARPELPDRLVVVTVGLELQAGRRRVCAWTLVPTTVGDALTAAKSHEWDINLPDTRLRRGEAEPPPLRFYAGTPDPLDESMFTIRYEFGAGVGTFAIRLRADGGLELRVDGPLRSIMPSQ